MIKYLKYMFMAAIAMMVATGCQEEAEDAFSTAPTAPTLTGNGSILMTQNTMNETVRWAWTASRYTQGTVSYALFAQYEETAAVQVGNATSELSLTLPKTELRTLLSSIEGVPQNASYTINFYVEATDDNDTYTSDKMATTIYAYGDAVPANATATQAELVLDSENAEAELQLLTWEAARLNYNEAITYAVKASYGDKSATLAEGLTETAYTTTVQAWNEFCIKSIGAPEAATSDVQLTVTAFSDTYPEGVPSTAVSISVTTYELPYPDEEYIYIPGDHQSWTPATAPRLRSANLDGVYTGFCYLNAQFKFTMQPAWGEGGAGEYNSSHFPNMGEGLSDAGGNIGIAAPGFYYLTADVMTGMLTATLINSWGAIGTATPGGWDAETPLTYDAAKGCWSGTMALTASELKFRANGTWDSGIDLGGTLDDLVFKGGNIAVAEAGTYTVELYLQRTDSEKMYCTLTK